MAKAAKTLPRRRKYLPDPILCLPFVKDRKSAYNLWSVRSLGDYDRDYELGRSYAITYLEWRKVSRHWPSLSFVLEHMARSKTADGIKWGFLNVVENATLIGTNQAIAHQLTIKDWESERNIRALLEGVSI